MMSKNADIKKRDEEKQMTVQIAELYLRDVISELKENLDTTLVDLWFKKSHIAACDEQSMTIVVENELKKNTINERYLERLEELFEKAIGKKMRIIVISSDDLNSEDNEVFTTAKKPNTVKEETEKEQTDEFTLYRDYTFESFVVGTSNKLAYTACRTVAKNPVLRINPLYLHGASGLGKTHLIYAIMNEAKINKPGIKILYVTGEDFTNELIASFATKNTKPFRDKYRNCDMLLVDDIQFIAGKVSIQEEFFHTFDTLYKMNKQIVLTSDIPPKDISPLDERLRTRFESGLIVDIQPPETELRVAIFKKKTMQMGLTLPAEVLDFLADNITLNVRQIEGAVKKLWAQSFINNEPITLTMAQTILTDYLREGKKLITPEHILNTVSKRYNIPKEDILGKKRTADIIYARHISIFLMQESTGLSLKKIGALFGKDHSTVISSRNNVITRMKSDSAFSKEIDEIREELKK